MGRRTTTTTSWVVGIIGGYIGYVEGHEQRPFSAPYAHYFILMVPAVPDSIKLFLVRSLLLPLGPLV